MHQISRFQVVHTYILAQSRSSLSAADCRHADTACFISVVAVLNISPDNIQYLGIISGCYWGESLCVDPRQIWSSLFQIILEPCVTAMVNHRRRSRVTPSLAASLSEGGGGCDVRRACLPTPDSVMSLSVVMWTTCNNATLEGDNNI